MHKRRNSFLPHRTNRETKGEGRNWREAESDSEERRNHRFIFPSLLAMYRKITMSS
jgi:hypothetical protein